MSGNYGSSDRLTDDGMSQGHPAFLQLGKTLEHAAEIQQVAAKFVLANCFDPQFVSLRFNIPSPEK